METKSITLQNYEKQIIYASVYFTILYKDSQKLEKTRKYRKPMPVNQRVLGSSPSSGAKALKKFSAFFVYIPLFGESEFIEIKKMTSI